MLVELSVVEQRCRAVLEVVGSLVPVTEVAERSGVSRKSLHAWVRRYEPAGLAGLADRSHRPHYQPRQAPPKIEALICELPGASPVGAAARGGRILVTRAGTIGDRLGAPG